MIVKLKIFLNSFWIMLSASYITPPPPPFALTCLTVTNNHIYWKQAIEMGAMYLDLFSTLTNTRSTNNNNNRV